MPIAIKFNDIENKKIVFRYYNTLPECLVAKKKINLHALKLYALYRNTLFGSYRRPEKRADIAKDILVKKPVFEEKNAVFMSQADETNSIYHYAIDVAIDSVKELQDTNQNMKSVFAYKESKIIGFISFQERMMEDREIVYIAHAGVTDRGNHIGRHLMQCVFLNYPVGTEFYVLTRVFNTDAQNLYSGRFKLNPISLEEIRALGYDERYCGFKGNTNQEMLDEIHLLIAYKTDIDKKIDLEDVKDIELKITEETSYTATPSFSQR